MSLIFAKILWRELRPVLSIQGVHDIAWVPPGIRTHQPALSHEPLRSYPLKGISRQESTGKIVIEEGFVTVSEDQDNRQQEAKVLLARILEYFDENDDEQSVDDSLDLGTKVLLEVKHKGYHYKLVQYQPALPPPSVQLSPREDEIVRMVAQGLPNKGIASVLDISPWTVATHLRRVFNKLGVRSRAEMVACVMENNLLEEA